jgi:hypothetical protein
MKCDVKIAYKWHNHTTSKNKTFRDIDAESLQAAARMIEAVYNTIEEATVLSISSEPSQTPVEFTDFDIDGINFDDAPDFCDAFICGATAVLSDGTTREATDAELEELNDDGDLVHQLVYERIY